jgi:hypothetical protein
MSVLAVTPQFVSPRATYRQCTLERNPHQACLGFIIGALLAPMVKWFQIS